MKRLALFLLLILVSFGFTAPKKVSVTVTNPLSTNRINETVEIAISDISKILKCDDYKSFVVFDEAGREIPSQVLFMGKKSPVKLIFQATVEGKSKAMYEIRNGKPSAYPPKTYGRLVPERFDDYSWENDRIAFRVYATALIVKDGPSNGIDVWVKRTEKLVVDKWVKDYKAGISSYHNDSGEGCDCYKVGRTLGAGAMAPFVNDSLWLGSNFESYQTLDNGPVRTSFSVVYPPFNVNGKMVTETRTFSLDAGSQLSAVTEEYSGYDAPMEVATGIVKRKEGRITAKSSEKGYASYCLEEGEGGITYLGVVATSPVVKIIEKNDHVLLTTNYNPGDKLLYYAGAGWSKWGFENEGKWNQYLDDFSARIQHPLVVKIK
ncbi:MAG: DUF4861 family protein [Bacteroidales bacterium]|nr:DUF4861 family protein [Bacteroidales bacterium]